MRTCSLSWCLLSSYRSLSVSHLGQSVSGHVAHTSPKQIDREGLEKAVHGLGNVGGFCHVKDNDIPLKMSHASKWGIGRRQKSEFDFFLHSIPHLRACSQLAS